MFSRPPNGIHFLVVPLFPVSLFSSPSSASCLWFSISRLAGIRNNPTSSSRAPFRKPNRGFSASPDFCCITSNPPFDLFHAAFDVGASGSYGFSGCDGIGFGFLFQVLDPSPSYPTGAPKFAGRGLSLWSSARWTVSAPFLWCLIVSR